MEKVLDVYWHCAEPGDNFLGRVLCGLNALSQDFNILPAHFIVESPMEDEVISMAMEIMYGPILAVWANTPQDPTGLLLRLLANVVYHFDWIKSVARTRTDHPFNSIPLFFHLEIVDALKEMVTTEPSSVIREATGIPPHVEQSVKMQKLLEIATQCLDLLQQQYGDVKKVITCLFIIILYFNFTSSSFNI